MFVKILIALGLIAIFGGFFGWVLAICEYDLERDEGVCDGDCNRCPFPPCSPEDRERRMKHDDP